MQIHQPFELPGYMQARENAKAKLARFPSYLASAQAFAASYGYLVQGVTDPTTFARNLQDAGKFGIDTTTGKPVKEYVPNVTNTINNYAAALAAGCSSSSSSDPYGPTPDFATVQAQYAKPTGTFGFQPREYYRLEDDAEIASRHRALT